MFSKALNSLSRRIWRTVYNIEGKTTVLQWEKIRTWTRQNLNKLSTFGPALPPYEQRKADSWCQFLLLITDITVHHKWNVQNKLSPPNLSQTTTTPTYATEQGIIPQDRKRWHQGGLISTLRSMTSHIQTKTSLDHRQQMSRRAARRDGEASGWSPTVSGPLAGGRGLSYRYVTCNQEAWCLILSELLIILVSGSLNSGFNCGCLGTFRDCVKIVDWEREVRKKY